MDDCETHQSIFESLVGFCNIYFLAKLQRYGITRVADPWMLLCLIGRISVEFIESQESRYEVPCHFGGTILIPFKALILEPYQVFSSALFSSRERMSTRLEQHESQDSK